MHEPPSLQKFAESIAAGLPDGELEALLDQLAADAALEAALRMLKQGKPLRASLVPRLTAAIAAARLARQASWQHDPRKLRLRMRYSRTGLAAALLPAAFLELLQDTFRKAGLVVALGLEKRPRPMLQLGHPLPLGTEGLQECLEVVLARSPGELELVQVLNRAAAEGLRFLSCEALPDHATPVLDLCRLAEWSWPCPEAWKADAAERVGAFLAAERFQIEKAGKEAGQKRIKQVEVRGLVQSMRWDGPLLRFELRLEPGHALHPAKLLGGILGLDPAAIQGLVRTRIDLAEDPRLDQAERFEPKLKNMFEDAVLLKAGPNLKVIDEDEDEPLRLG